MKLTNWSHTRAAIALLAGFAMVAVGCSDGSDSSSSTTAPPRAAEPEMLEVTITADAIEGLPAELAAGAVTIDITADDPESSLDVSLVSEGTTEEDFRAGLASIVTGGPFPESFENNAGAVQGGSTVVLEPGDYFAWSEPPSGDNEEPTPAEDFIVTPLIVTEGTDGALPETAGTITAVDYGFAVDVQAGDSFTFVNDGAEQFHHAIVLNFGTNDPAAVEENLLPFIQSEDGVVPGLDVDPEMIDAGQSGVFGPGNTGTAPATFEDGNTYAVVCFISDRAGGAPHIFQENMFEVFTVGAAAG